MKALHAAVELEQTLGMVADALQVCAEPWWVISGAAAALHGETSIPVADVDVLLSPADAWKVREHVEGVVSADPASERFRSDVFFRWHAPPLVVEFMAGFRVRVAERWRPVKPSTRIVLNVGGATIFVPDREELIGIFEIFGRPKDLLRADRLRGA